jgi:hypothetical protein
VPLFRREPAPGESTKRTRADAAKYKQLKRTARRGGRMSGKDAERLAAGDPAESLFRQARRAGRGRGRS